MLFNFLTNSLCVLLLAQDVNGRWSSAAEKQKQKASSVASRTADVPTEEQPGSKESKDVRVLFISICPLLCLFILH